MQFEVEALGERWFVSDGAVRFGPYSTEAKASDAAASLNRQRAWSQLTPSELVERQGQ